MVRQLKCINLPPEQKQPKMAQLFAHYFKVSGGLRDLVPDSWNKRIDYDMDSFRPLTPEEKPTPQQ